MNLFEILRSKQFSQGVETLFLQPYLHWLGGQVAASRRYVVSESIVKKFHADLDGPGKATEGIKRIRGLTIKAESLWLEYALPREWQLGQGSQVDKVGVLVNEFRPGQVTEVIHPKYPTDSLLVLSFVWNFVGNSNNLNAAALSIFVDTGKDEPSWFDYLDTAVQAESVISWFSKIFEKNESTIRAQFDRRIVSRRTRGSLVRAELDKRRLTLSEGEFGAQLEFSRKVELVPNQLGMLMIERLPESRVPEALRQLTDITSRDVEPDLPRVFAMLNGLVNDEFNCRTIEPDKEGNRLRRLRNLPPALSYEDVTLRA